MDAPTQRTDIVITLDILSGRENPSWNLDPQSVPELEARLKDLPQQPPFFVDRLGYRGFNILVRWATEYPTLPSMVHVYKSNITYHTGNEMKGGKDVHHLEDWLIGLAQEKGYGRLIEEGRSK